MKQFLEGKADVNKLKAVPIGGINVGDSAEITLSIEDNGQKLDISSALKFTLISAINGSKVIDKTCVRYLEDNKVLITLGDQYAQIAGLVENQINIKLNTGITTVIFYLTINQGILNGTPSDSAFVNGPMGPTGPTGPKGEKGDGLDINTMTPEQIAERMDVPMKFVNACMR